MCSPKKGLKSFVLCHLVMAHDHYLRGFDENCCRQIFITASNRECYDSYLGVYTLQNYANHMVSTSIAIYIYIYVYIHISLRVILFRNIITNRINKSIRGILMLVLLDILSWPYMKNQTNIMTDLYISGI